MSSRLDWLRSVVRDVADVSIEKALESRPIASARQALDELRARRVRISQSAFGAALAALPDVDGATASIDDEAIRIHLSYESGDEMGISARPERARFAIRGAKEVVFSVEPVDAVEAPRSRDAVGALGGVIAAQLYGPFLGHVEAESALVDREGARLRVDLRTVPAIRDGFEGPRGMMLDMLNVEGFELNTGELQMHLGLAGF